jgi:hypothetical protein
MLLETGFPLSVEFALFLPFFVANKKVTFLQGVKNIFFPKLFYSRIWRTATRET